MIFIYPSELHATSHGQLCQVTSSTSRRRKFGLRRLAKRAYTVHINTAAKALYSRHRPESLRRPPGKVMYVPLYVVRSHPTKSVSIAESAASSGPITLHGCLAHPLISINTLYGGPPESVICTVALMLQMLVRIRLTRVPQYSSSSSCVAQRVSEPSPYVGQKGYYEDFVRRPLARFTVLYLPSLPLDICLSPILHW